MICSGDFNKRTVSLLLAGFLFLVSPPLLLAETKPASPTNLRFGTPIPPPGGGPVITNVSGTLKHGAELKINGSGFGAHADYSNGATWFDKPMLCAAFWDFHDGALDGGGWIADFGYPEALPHDDYLKVDASVKRPHRAYSGKKLQSASVMFNHWQGAEARTTYYYSFMMRIPINWTGGKILRTWGTGLARQFYIGANPTNWYYLWKIPNPDASPPEYYLAPGGKLAFTAYSTGDDYTALFYSDVTIPVEAWNQFELYVSPSLTRLHLNGVLVKEYDSNIMPSGWTGVNQEQGNLSEAPLDAERLPDHPGGATGWAPMPICEAVTWNRYQHYDALYVSHTAARVVLGNASTLADCTVREPQVPRSWSNTSITIGVNTGAFAPGAQVWLFVFNANDVASPGMPVTLADEGRR